MCKALNKCKLLLKEQTNFLKARTIKIRLGETEESTFLRVESILNSQLYVPVTVHREQSMKKEYQQDATI